MANKKTPFCCSIVHFVPPTLVIFPISASTQLPILNTHF
jgi:hypothetical protein